MMSRRMSRIFRCMVGLLLAAALPLAMTAPARADDVADFYRGKRINLVVGYGTGGGYDLYARMLGRFLGDHIPASPPSLRRTCRAPAAAAPPTGSTKSPPRTGP